MYITYTHVSGVTKLTKSEKGKAIHSITQGSILYINDMPIGASKTIYFSDDTIIFTWHKNENNKLSHTKAWIK